MDSMELRFAMLVNEMSAEERFQALRRLAKRVNADLDGALARSGYRAEVHVSRVSPPTQEHDDGGGRSQ